MTLKTIRTNSYGHSKFRALVKDTTSEASKTTSAKGGAGKTTEHGGDGAKIPLAFECVITINTGVESGVIILTPFLDETMSLPSRV